MRFLNEWKARNNRLPGTTREENPSQHRLAYIDTLRGLAAGWVFLLHVQTYWLRDLRLTGWSLDRLLLTFAGLGGLGVDLFIVLSGFCLFLPLVRWQRRAAILFDARHFLTRRAWRLLPAYYAALAVATALALIPALQPLLVGRPVAPGDVLAYTLLVQTWSAWHTSAINGSLWSIALEAQLYLLFPLLVALYRREGLKAILTAGLVSAVAWPWLHDAVVRLTGIPFGAEFNFPARWIEFICGMTAADAMSHPRGWNRTGVCFLIGGGMVATLVFHTGLWGHFPPMLRDLSAGGTFALVVLYSAKLPSRHFRGRAPGAHLGRFGAISYSFYLLHQPVLLLTAPLARWIGYRPAAGFALALITAFPITLIIARLSYRLIELPNLRLGQRRDLSATGEPAFNQALP